MSSTELNDGSKKEKGYVVKSRGLATAMVKLNDVRKSLRVKNQTLSATSSKTNPPETPTYRVERLRPCLKYHGNLATYCASGTRCKDLHSESAQLEVTKSHSSIKSKSSLGSYNQSTNSKETFNKKKGKENHTEDGSSGSCSNCVDPFIFRCGRNPDECAKAYMEAATYKRLPEHLFKNSWVALPATTLTMVTRSELRYEPSSSSLTFGKRPSESGSSLRSPTPPRHTNASPQTSASSSSSRRTSANHIINTVTAYNHDHSLHNNSLSSRKAVRKEEPVKRRTSVELSVPTLSFELKGRDTHSLRGDSPSSNKSSGSDTKSVFRRVLADRASPRSPEVVKSAGGTSLRGAATTTSLSPRSSASIRSDITPRTTTQKPKIVAIANKKNLTKTTLTAMAMRNMKPKVKKSINTKKSSKF